MDLVYLLLALVTTVLPPAPRDVLRAWDEHRAAAWVSGDAVELRGLYLPGSSAGDHDVALLRDYQRRGLDVRALETQVLGLAVLVRRHDRIVLRVSDRVAELEVTRAGEEVHLPRDRARTRTVELRRVGGRLGSRWLVARVSAG